VFVFVFVFVIMGNAVLKEYNVSREQRASVGTGGYWKMYHATHKQSSEGVSVLVLEKKTLPKSLQNEKFYTTIRHGATQMMKLKHPSVIGLLHPLDESRSAFALVTRQFDFGLNGIMGDYTNIEPASIPAELKSYQMTALDVKNGLRQIAEALQFCHQQARVYHNHVSPSNIVVTDRGDWKLFGFDFSTHAEVSVCVCVC
jgi:SCY1-like protein 2